MDFSNLRKSPLISTTIEFLVSYRWKNRHEHPFHLQPNPSVNHLSHRPVKNAKNINYYQQTRNKTKNLFWSNCELKVTENPCVFLSNEFLMLKNRINSLRDSRKWEMCIFSMIFCETMIGTYLIQFHEWSSTLWKHFISYNGWFHFLADCE